MAPLRIPEEGLSLQGAPCSLPDGDIGDNGALSQVMRLDLADGVLEDILKASRMRKDIHMSFGKTITIHYGPRSQQLLSIAQPTQSELYKYSPHKEDEIRFAGLLTHKLAQKKVQESTAGADAALAELQSKMASHQQNKQSKQIKVLAETPTASPTIRSTHPKPKGANFFAALKSQQMKRPITPLNNAMARSTPVSPAVTATRPGPAISIAPRSTPVIHDEKAQKLQALKFPLLHLVAIRPMSLKFLANTVCCSQEECKQVLEKIGKPARLDPDKWDLSDKAFKDLDVWGFNYKLDDDRELAIEHAISAYDRMRLSREDKLWQMLLPKPERGKGKVLSKLQLHQGPIQKSSTPKIHVQKTSEDQVSESTANPEGDEKQHLAPSDAPLMARSQSSDQIKRKRVSEKEAQAKRLLSTKPKKQGAALKASAAPKTNANPKANDVTKKKVVKKAASGGSNVKSTEFVHDSDEDEEMEDAAVSSSQPPMFVNKTSEKDSKSQSKTSATEDHATIKRLQQLEKDRNRPKSAHGSSKSNSTAIKQPPSSVSTPAPKHRLSDASQSSTSSSKLSRQRTTSSPLKPSPLGSSPPTNASELENDSQLLNTSNSSTASTPLLAQPRSASLVTKQRPDPTKRLPNPAVNTSEHSLKRKADDIDSGIHNHDVPSVNGHITPAAKRAKTSAPLSPAADSSSSDSSPIPHSVLSQAQRFKEYYAKYELLYREISTQAGAAPEKIDTLVKMHKRLQTMKDEIARAAVQG
ncbi:MAG: hypothetical protein Q9219_002929 [cf. Caloplaca sp. 3 TL-2023]